MENLKRIQKLYSQFGWILIDAKYGIVTFVRDSATGGLEYLNVDEKTGKKLK